MMITLRRLALSFTFLAAVAVAQVETGKPAPAFKAEGHDGKEVSFPPKGHWAVLAFYPKASTGG